jgi:hypothetical protein
MRRRIPRTKGALTGLLLIILGLWGALIPFVGPYFNYALHADQTWQWFADRGWLEVLPGVLTVIGGFMLMTGNTRGGMSLGGLLALIGGLWFIVGPQVSTLWHHGSMTIGPAVAKHNFTRMLEWVGFHYGLGGLITMFSSYALGFLAALPIVDERVVGRTVAAAGAGAGAGYAAGRASAGRRADAPADRDTTVREPAPVAQRDTTAERDTAAAPRARTGRFFRRRRATTRT